MPDAPWIEIRELSSERELKLFGEFSKLLVKGDRNVGEAGVLALAKVVAGTAVVDDSAGRKAAITHHVDLRPTLALLCDAIHAELLTVKLVSALADDLLATEYRLPFKRGRFEQWATDNDMF